MIIDISWPIGENSTTYKNKKNISIVSTKSFDGDHVRESQLNISAHTGTHIDAPAHFMEHGNTIDKNDLQSTIGYCKVLDFTNIKTAIEEKDLVSHNIEKDDIILLKTKNSSLSPTEPFNPNFIYLEKSGAEYLVKQKAKCVGIDYLGIERGQPNHETHKILLLHNIIIIEGLRLGGVEPSSYKLFCLPINLIGTEAAPARAILIQE
jgi:arylformamidase